MYAPLYGRVVKQELLRSLLYLKSTRNEEPILHSMTSSSKGTREIDSVLDKKIFIKVLTDENRGLARPALLKLIYQYEILLDWEGLDIDGRSDMDAARLEVSRSLVNQIIVDTN